ncbi:MAG TPA: hypothetical protein VIP11_12575, partial [Gemmatimonadaceae bacterium]
MKLWGIFRFELAYQIRRVWPWLILVVLFVLDFLMTRDGMLTEALFTDFFINSPFAVAKTTVFGGIIWLLVAAAVAGEAGARDVSTGMYPLVYTAPISKVEYLGGRFLAALVLNLFLLLIAVQAAILVGIYAPGVDPRSLGPFRPAAFLTAYVYLAVPNAIVATVIQFALSVRSDRPMASYLGSLFLLFMGFFVAGLLLFRKSLGALLDPVGIRFVLDDLSHQWTTVEKSVRLLSLDGPVLANRLLWISVALVALAITWTRFRFAHRVETGSWWRRKPRRAILATNSEGSVVAEKQIARLDWNAVQKFGIGIQARQTLAIAWSSLRAMAKSWTGLALLVVIPLLSIPVVIDQMVAGGAPLTPVTGQVLKELTGPISSELSRWVIIPLLTVFFAGELVWREREAGVSEISDATPVPEWIPLLGKFLGLSLLLAAFSAALTIAGMLAQVSLGYQNFEIGLYLKILFGLQLPEYVLFAVLAFVVHVIVNQKYVAHLVAIILYVIIILAPMFGIEHNLLIYGAGPWWTYTEMRGLGPFIAPWLWFKLYWAAWAFLLAVAARLLWVRGRETGLAVRLQIARRRFTRATLLAAGTAVGLVLSLGGFVFYNTNVLNEYRNGFDQAERSAEYERRYARYARVPQPQLTSANLRIDVRPEQREVEIRGSYRLVNRSAVAIDSIHVGTARRGETRAMTFDRQASSVLTDEDLGYRIYALERPLQPGDSLRLDFQVSGGSHGFGQSGANISVVPNGTYLTNAWFPAIGYQQSRELLTANDRREHGLGPRPVIPSLYDAEARKNRNEGIVLETVMSTDPKQIAVAPGALRRAWMEGGRRYFQYSTDAPIGSEWSFASADYAVREAQWKDVAIRILHHPGHTSHLEWMVRSIRASLDYYSAEFGPYQYRNLTVVEVPGDGIGIHAEPSMLTHGEGITHMKARDPERLDFPFAMTAHEIAHQWTVPIASVEGAPVMSESIAWYYAIKLLEHEKGLEQVRQQLSFMREPYPFAPIRRGEPLLRGLDPYMSYRRGPFALYALSRYIGEERVNGALRRLVEKHEAQGAPLATTLDLYAELKAVTPDSLRYLLHDLFEVNTFWTFDTKQGTAEQIDANTWRVTLDVDAQKVVVDTAGVPTTLPMDELVEIGIFAPAEANESLGKPLYVQKHRIRSGRQTITVTLSERPDRAGIDPYNL